MHFFYERFFRRVISQNQVLSGEKSLGLKLY
jgi:hypothetical protein